MNLLEAARNRMRQRQLAWLLFDGEWLYWHKDIEGAIEKLRELYDEVIQEPPPDSKEYQDGERKSATPDDKQEIEEEELPTTLWQSGDRDEDGYLIR